jgi:hypothetical protein
MIGIPYAQVGRKQKLSLDTDTKASDLLRILIQCKTKQHIQGSDLI